MSRQKVTISLEPELVQRIDEDRGLIPRSRYIEKLLKESLANTQNNSPHKVRIRPGPSHPRPARPVQPRPDPFHPDPTVPNQTRDKNE